MILKEIIASNGSEIPNKYNISSKKKLNPIKKAMKYKRVYCRKNATKHKGSVMNNNQPRKKFLISERAFNSARQHAARLPMCKVDNGEQ